MQAHKPGRDFVKRQYHNYLDSKEYEEFLSSKEYRKCLKTEENICQRMLPHMEKEMCAISAANVCQQQYFNYPDREQREAYGS